jgi:hypothetical protein
MITLSRHYSTREGGPVRLSGISITGEMYPVKGQYWDSAYREWKSAQWTLSGEYDVEVISSEDLVQI